MENTKTIYVVTSYCGYDTYYDVIECAFESKEDAQSYIDSERERVDSVSDELLQEINEAIDKEEDKITAKYWQGDCYDELIDGASEEEYDKEIDEWWNNGIKKFVENAFNIPYENYLVKQEYTNGEKFGYEITETKLYINNKL